MLKITDEMREKLRKPLPPEAVSPHPTKTYLSSIKSIYVAERITDVFGVGSWTLKSTHIETADKMVVVQTVLEIPEYGFYGESYGGNDNVDKGDAYKGATTDALTKIAAQQLEIGIDVFKGLGSTAAKSKPAAKAPAPATASKEEHWCKEHQVKFFKTARMRSYAHLIAGTKDWCNEPTEDTPVSTTEPEKATPPKQAAAANGRDLSLLKTQTDMVKAVLEDFKLPPSHTLKELGYSSWGDVKLTPAECYLQIQAMPKKS